MSEMTFPEITERLKALDEVTLLELLNIDSDMLVDAFMDRIEDRIEKLKQEIDYDL